MKAVGKLIPYNWWKIKGVLQGKAGRIAGYGSNLAFARNLLNGQVRNVSMAVEHRTRRSFRIWVKEELNEVT